MDAKMVIICGVDRSGKGSLMKEIHKQTNYKHILVDRGPMGYRAYALIHERSERLIRNYMQLEIELNKLPNILLIYLDCEVRELEKRCKESNHEVLDFERHKRLYEFCYHTTPIKNKIAIDTTFRKPEHIVRKLIQEGLL